MSWLRPTILGQTLGHPLDPGGTRLGPAMSVPLPLTKCHDPPTRRHSACRLQDKHPLRIDTPPTITSSPHQLDSLYPSYTRDPGGSRQVDPNVLDPCAEWLLRRICRTSLGPVETLAVQNRISPMYRSLRRTPGGRWAWEWDHRGTSPSLGVYRLHQ